MIHVSVIEADAALVPSKILVMAVSLTTTVVPVQPSDYSTPEKVLDLVRKCAHGLVSIDAELRRGGGETSGAATDPASSENVDQPATAMDTGTGQREADGIDEGVDESTLGLIERPQARSLEGSSIVAGPWANLSVETRKKFDDLVDRFSLQKDERGYPIPKTPDGTIGGKNYILDPFGTGKKYSMLKRRLSVLELTEDDLIRFFGWEGRVVRMVSKKYSDQKRRESIETGFVRKKGSKVGPRRAKAVEEV